MDPQTGWIGGSFELSEDGMEGREGVQWRSRLWKQLSCARHVTLVGQCLSCSNSEKRGFGNTQCSRDLRAGGGEVVSLINQGRPAQLVSQSLPEKP